MRLRINFLLLSIWAFATVYALQVLAPKEGVVVQKNETLTIEWYYDGFFHDVFIDLYVADGTWILRVADAPARTDDASFDWVIPAAVPAGEYFLMITSDCYSGCDSGNSSQFSIQGASCNVYFENNTCPTNDPHYECSFHGFCDTKNSTCTCLPGWGGIDCSEIQTISRLAVEVSNMGMIFSYWASTNLTYIQHMVETTSWNNPLLSAPILRQVQLDSSVIQYMVLNFTVAVYVVIGSSPPVQWDNWWGENEPNCTDSTLAQYGCFHSGFLQKARVVWADYQRHFPLHNSINSSVVIHGHGTGGAIAVLLGLLMRLESSLMIAGVNTYGQPAVTYSASDKISVLFQWIALVRFVNAADPVARMPAGAIHYGYEIHYYPDGSYSIVTECLVGTLRPLSWMQEAASVLDYIVTQSQSSPLARSVLNVVGIEPYLVVLNDVVHGNLLKIIPDVLDIFMDFDSNKLSIRQQ